MLVGQVLSEPPVSFSVNSSEEGSTLWRWRFSCASILRVTEACEHGIRPRMIDGRVMVMERWWRLGVVTHG